MPRWFVAIILACLPLCFGQTTTRTRDPIRAETAKNIASLSTKFAELRTVTPREKALQAQCHVNCSGAISEELDQAYAQTLAAMDEVASQIHHEVDGYVVRTVNPKHADLDSKSVVQDLKQILGDEALGPPSAFILSSPKGSALIIAYTIAKGFVAGNGATSVTLRAYNATAGGLKLQSVTGNDDMGGYTNVSVRELPSPVPGETWLLLWGQMTGANGPNIKMRVYAYDGKKFRTMWMPANAWGNFTIHINDNGFTVDGEYYRSGKKRHDAYTLTPEGLYLVDLHQ